MLQHHTGETNFALELHSNCRQSQRDRDRKDERDEHATRAKRFHKILRAHSKKLYCNVKETRLLVPVIAS
jgi:hypothetical protein